jgi:inner membrane protease subunit 2
MLNLATNLKIVFKTLAYGIPVGITIIDVGGYVAKVEGYSMQPVLNPRHNSSDYVFLNNWLVATNSFDKISRGDIVSLISPKDPRQRLIKRVIGLGGDIVETHGYRAPYVRIPQGHCWVEGDHRGNSLDSNSFGPVAVGLIKSRATCIVWPPNRWQFLTHQTPPASVKGTSVKSVEDRDAETYGTNPNVGKLS